MKKYSFYGLIFFVVLMAIIAFSYFSISNDSNVLAEEKPAPFVEYRKMSLGPDKGQAFKENILTKKLKTLTDDESTLSDNSFEDNEKTEEDSLKVSRREMIEMMGGNEKSLRIYDNYNKGEYDPSFDESWKYDMESAVYAEVYNSALQGMASVESYQCGDDERCSVQLFLSEKTGTTMRNISDYVLNLRDQPSIMKSGKRRNVYLVSIGQGENGFNVEIAIGEK
jgi:hypothetical protein